MWPYPCVGCGRLVRLSFRVWLYYLLNDEYPYLHLQCAQDMLDQRRLDGLDE